MKGHELIHLLLVGCFSLTGCVEQTNSGVLTRDSNTYFISVQTAPAPLGKGSAESRRVAYKEANGHCLQQGKKMLIVNEASGPATVNLTFRCASTEEKEMK